MPARACVELLVCHRLAAPNGRGARGDRGGTTTSRRAGAQALRSTDFAAGPEIARIKDLAASDPAIDLLVLFGSRARGDARSGSDWDFGYVARNGFAPEGFVARLVGGLGTERVDLADLDRAGAAEYRSLDLARLEAVARTRPPDLKEFLVRLRDRL